VSGYGSALRIRQEARMLVAIEDVVERNRTIES